MSYSVCFSFSTVKMFLAICQLKQCSCLIFHVFSIFSLDSRSYSVHSSFSQYLSVSHPITGHTMFVSHFPSFSVFLAIFQVLQCAFLIFQVFQCFSTYSTSYSVCFSFSTIFIFLAILQILECAFLIFHG